MPRQTVRYDVTGSILTLTLDRPDQLNAFTVDMADDLVAAFEEAATDPRVAAVVVTGSGRAFCAGMDLTSEGNVFGLDESLTPTLDDMRTRLHDPEIERGVRDTGGRVALAIYQCPKPVIAAINGPAVGIGATMTLPMDFRLVSVEARIGFVFGRLGIVPEACSTWFLPRIVGMQNALEVAYRADIFDAEQAHRYGLVRAVYPPEELLPAAYEFAHSLIDGRSAVATALTRQMLYRNSAAASPLEAHRIESLAMFYASTGDGKEGVAAFLEKRPPEFRSDIPAYLPAFARDSERWQQ
ncbi:crotonase/enoyl-CoA hydratase family protein [Nocardia carnea]|uniref:crotonase/enoyl-CoA hydratase family protein n=1 Tax=Nocardia carnea TaxID=37328 RepID=UPI0024565866|nr:crotonase/enoyl-CoA hydratase family protein [Nocardia carnea]